MSLKILFVLGFPNPFPGAAWTRVSFFADKWSKKGHIVEILGTFSYKTFNKRGVKKLKNINIFNIIFHIGSLHPLACILNIITSFVVSIFVLFSRKPNVVIVSVPTGDIGLGALIACRLTKTKHIVDYRDEWEDYMISLTNSSINKLFYSILKKISASIYARSHLVITVTPDFAYSLRERGIANVRLLPNGADITIFKRYNRNAVRRKLRLNDTDFIIVYNGLVGWYYKLDVIIRALAKLSQKIKNIKLLIIGEGPDILRILALSNDLNLCGNVLYLGVKNNRKEIAEILSACDVGIIPGLYSKGQLPVKFFEYSACEIPTIAIIPPDSLLAKLIRRYGIGIIVPPADEDKLIEAIHHIYEDELFRIIAGRKARLFIEEKFDRNKIADEFFKLIENCVSIND